MKDDMVLFKFGLRNNIYFYVPSYVRECDSVWN